MAFVRAGVARPVQTTDLRMVVLLLLLLRVVMLLLRILV